MQARGTEVPKVKLHEGLTEVVAHNYEVTLIAAIGRKPHGPLVNETDGGEGASGYKFKPENIRRGFTHSSETRAKIAAQRVGWKRPPEVTERIVAKLRGKKQTPERIEKRISKIRGRKYSDGHVANMAAALRGRNLSDEHAAKGRAILRALSDDPAIRAKREQARLEALRKPEVRAANAERGRMMWNDPAIRAKILAGRRAAKNKELRLRFCGGCSICDIPPFHHGQGGGASGWMCSHAASLSQADIISAYAETDRCK